jgi:5-oxoprolinase (ATP-hydrolysing) subunit A
MNIDINCDLGEHFGVWKTGDDEAILPYISSANIACGFHAGDPKHIFQTIQGCIRHKVQIGAHPSFPDKEGFGRRNMHCSSEDVFTMVMYQVAALKGMAEAAGSRLHHVKPHGALYNMAASDHSLAEAIVKAVGHFGTELILFGPPDSALEKAAHSAGLPFWREGFMDRAYLPDGRLAPRTDALAVHKDIITIIGQALTLIQDKKVRTTNGIIIEMDIQTICLHGDHANAAETARQLKAALLANNIQIGYPK